MSNWYLDYCRDNGIPIKYGKERDAHERSLRRQYNRARSLEKEDLSSFTSREDAQKHLLQKSEEMTVGMTGLELLIFQSIIGWLIKKLLDRVFG